MNSAQYFRSKRRLWLRFSFLQLLKLHFFELAIIVVKSDNPGSGSNKNLGKKPGSR